MAVKFLLPCSCGRQIPVEASHAGLTLSCECGKQLDVPMRRDLEKLPRAASEENSGAAPPASWGLKQGLILAGMLIAVPALACAIYLVSTMPRDPVAAIIEQQTPSQSLGTWQHMRQGIRTGNDPLTVAYVKQRESQQMAANFAWAAFAVGAAITASGVIMLLKGRSGATRRSAHA